MYRVVIWHSQGRGYYGPALPLKEARALADSLRAEFCRPGGGLHSVGLEELSDADSGG